ncbi:DUF6302 family protein [Streptomyces angustmyceticus]|uniref:DUF6302 family protein n=1 Tax=Streptomyces angustmyceticus TaxID=285578 RepID=UPI003D8A7738
MNITSTRARLLPAREAYDYEYFRERLADPALADAGFAVALLGTPLLAVPVGGMRRGGYASFGNVVDALQARALLGAVPGFPGLRVRWSPYRDTCHTVEWGEPAPQWWEGDGIFGRFFGYSADVIADFLRQRSQTPSSATSDPRSPAATSQSASPNSRCRSPFTNTIWEIHMTGNAPSQRVSLAPQATDEETVVAARALSRALDAAGLGGIRPVLDDEKDGPCIKLHGINADAAIRLGHLVRAGTDENYLLAEELRIALLAHDLNDIPVPQVWGTKIALGEVSIRTAERLARILGAPPGPELDESPDWPEAKDIFDKLNAALKATDVDVFVDMWLHPYCRRCDGSTAIVLGNIKVDVARQFLKALRNAARRP